MKKIIISAALIMAALFFTPAVLAQPEEGEVDVVMFTNPDEDFLIEHAEFDGGEPDILFAAADDAEVFEMKDGKWGENIKEKLDLTDDQKEKIRSMRLAHQEKMIDLKAALQKARLQAKEQRHSDNFNRSEVLSNVEKLNKIRNEIALASANHRMDVYEVLTPDQKKVWKEFRDEHPMRPMGHKKKFFEKRMELHHK